MEYVITAILSFGFGVGIFMKDFKKFDDYVEAREDYYNKKDKEWLIGLGVKMAEEIRSSNERKQ